MGHPLRPALAAFPFLADLDDDGVADLARAIQPMTLDAGQPLFRQDDASDGCYFVTDGLLRITAEHEGTSLRLGDVGVGAVVGEIGLVDDGPRSAAVVAVRPSTLLRIDRAEFQFLRLHRRPAAHTLLRGIAGILAARHRSTIERVSDLLGPAATAPEPPRAKTLLDRVAFWRRG